MTATLNESFAAHDAAETISEVHPAGWAFINDWRVEPQANDRTPVLGTGASSKQASPSARRSTARRQHQAMFRAWSQKRHD